MSLRDHKKVNAVETLRFILVRNVFVRTSPFWHYWGVTIDWLLMLDFQPIKTVCVREWRMVVTLAAYVSARQKSDTID